MWIKSSKRLLTVYGEIRLYVTDIAYDRNQLPYRIYLFVSHLGTEIELTVRNILATRRMRSHKAVLHEVSFDAGLDFLLVLDNRRGNHFIYCRSDTYQQLIDRALPPSKLRSPDIDNQDPASIPATSALDILDRKNKIIMLDSAYIPVCYTELESWLKHHEVIVSPYYADRLHAVVEDKAQLQHVLDAIERLDAMPGSKLITDQFVDVTLAPYDTSDYSDDNTYLQALAHQLPVTVSQIVFVTGDSQWSMKWRLQGFSVIDPAGLSDGLTGSADADPQSTYEAAANPSQLLDSGLPPRKDKHSGHSRSRSARGSRARSLLNFFFIFIL
jgi:hypothetical protein